MTRYGFRKGFSITTESIVAPCERSSVSQALAAPGPGGGDDQRIPDREPRVPAQGDGGSDQRRVARHGWEAGELGSRAVGQRTGVASATWALSYHEPPVSYQFSLIRFVPDPARGEFVNIAAVVGDDEARDWDLRLISNLRRARALDREGVLPAALGFVAHLDQRVGAIEQPP